MYLLTIMIWFSSHNVFAFTKELPTERLCHEVGASYHTMAQQRNDGWGSTNTNVRYQCIKMDK